MPGSTGRSFTLPRGANFKRGAERDAHTAKIRSKPTKLALDQREQPVVEPEGPVESPFAVEQRRATTAMKAVRSAQWQRPTFSPDGHLVARELGAEFFLDHEDVSEVIETEAPSFDSWTIVLTPLGFALVEPGKIPSLIEPEEIPDRLEFRSAGDGRFRLVEPLPID